VNAGAASNTRWLLSVLWLSTACQTAGPSTSPEDSLDAGVHAGDLPGPSAPTASPSSAGGRDAMPPANTTADPRLDPKASADAAAPTSDAQPDAGAAFDRWVTFHNGGFWNDSQGKRIEAHGGGFIRHDDSWYWVGEDKSQSSANFHSVNCYASPDLVHWEFRSEIITRNTAPELAAADRIIERPKVVYNEKTHTFVMWLHWEGKNYAEAAAGVFSSSRIDGDYTFRKSFRPKGNMSRDDNLFVDDDGKAYFVSAANENADLILYELTDDYLDIARQIVTLWPGSKREAPVLFKQGGRYYMITSAATGWDANQAKYASAASIEGPWSALSNLGNGTTFDTQPSYVLPIVGTRATTLLYAGDRWNDPELGDSKYIWLPLKRTGQSLALDDYRDWSLNLTTGEWSAAGDDALPQGGWSLLSVSSEETEAEDGHAVRAFDHSPSTFWHSRYSGTRAEYPHDLSIDLGATYELVGLRYLPRQDGNANGQIADYEFYASLDASQWGAAVSTGKFATGAAAKQLAFAPTLARYVRLHAISEQAGRSYAAVAELDLLGSPR
jgi:hypothetical protein